MPNTRVTDQYVDPAKIIEHLLDGAARLNGIPQIGLNHQVFTALAPHLGLGMRKSHPVTPQNGNIRTRLRQHLRRHRANPLEPPVTNALLPARDKRSM